MNDTQRPNPTPPPTLETIPLEVLEHIAFFVATTDLKRPPSDLASLCCTSKSLHRLLSLSGNASLYAAIFRFKFDVAAPIRRLGPDHTNAPCFAAELRKRYEGMKRIRAGIGSRAYEDANRENDLWMAIFMMLENEGKNAVQLKQFASVEQWLQCFFLDHSGGSHASNDMYTKHWPRDNQDNRLAMWLLWLCDAEGSTLGYSSTVCRMYSEVLRAYALGANKYPLTQHSWTNFSRSCVLPTTRGQVYTHYNLPLVPTAPPISVSAILGYVSRIKDPGRLLFSQSLDIFVSAFETVPTSPREQQGNGRPSTELSYSQRWDCDWERCIGVGSRGESANAVNSLERFYRPGALEGAWEGLFTYTEFTAYAAILSGGPPQALHDGAIGQNLQVWKLREYNLYSSPGSDALQGSLPPGEAFEAFFPPVTVEEKADHVVFNHGSREIIYSRALRHARREDDASDKTLCDVLVLGEGHSSWGKFKLKGRVRASDAFVTILKEYDGADDRGRWLYRGYLVGGRLAGRWRDALTPLRLEGYEGGFELSQRA